MSWQEPGVVGIVGDQPAVVWVSQVRGETGGRILKIVLTFFKKMRNMRGETYLLFGAK